MIVELTIECLGSNFKEADCSKIVEFDTTDSLEALYHLIITAFEFDWDHMSMFFIGRTDNPYSHGNKVIYQKGPDNFYGDKRNIGDYQMTLDELYPLPNGFKLFYHYDFGDDWVFPIKKSRKKPFAPVPGVTYPRVIEAIGDNPQQY